MSARTGAGGRDPVSRPAIRGPSARRRLQLAWRSERWLIAAALATSVAIAVGTAGEHWQFVFTLAFVLLAGGLYVRWPTAGLSVLLVLWIFAPFSRRLLDYIAYSAGPDLLSLAPYLATAVIGLIALQQHRPSARLLAILAFVWIGFAIGVPIGLEDPPRLLYGLFAYLSASLALLIGYADWSRGNLAIERILLVLLPVVAGYGLYQYFAPTLPPWDQLWIEATNFITVGSKETGDFRFFSVLNSPGTLAGLLTVLLAMMIVARKVSVVRLLAGGLALVCVALIGIRSAWVGLAGALLLVTLFSGGRTMIRLIVVCVAIAGLFVAIGGSSAGSRISDQASSFESLSQDKSFRDRLQAIEQYGPQAAAAPLGHGVGSVGAAARLSTQGSEPAPFEDNGYLLILWQVGLLGFLFVIGAAGYAIAYGARATARARLPDRLALIAPLLAVIVLMASGDALYGIVGVIFWYFTGALLRASEACDLPGGRA